MAVPTYDNDPELDAALQARGIGVQSIEAQRRAIIDSKFGHNERRYQKAAYEIHNLVWNWLEANTDWEDGQRFHIVNNTAVGTGARIEWSPNPSGPIVTASTTPTSWLVNTAITQGDILSKQIRLPKVVGMPRLDAIGRGYGNHPDVVDARLQLQVESYQRVVVPELAEVMAVSGLPAEILEVANS